MNAADPLAALRAERVERIKCPKCRKTLDLSGQEPFARVECPECHARLRVPLKLGEFLLLEQKGKGGMGLVFRAYDSSLGRQVAIKVMQSGEGAAGAVESFLHEARAVAALNHPNIVQIYSCGHAGGQLYIVMELIDGGALEDLLKRPQPADEEALLRTAMGVTRGLEAAHAKGMVHGDIKPANILFTKDGTPKVVDFGLASLIHRQNPKEIWGTPYYLAPEKARKEKSDQRADIYSLGATLFHVLTGQPPFEGEDSTAVVLARLKDPAPALRSVRPDLHPATETLIGRMLEPDPRLRHPTYASVLSDLDLALKETQAGPAPGMGARRRRGGRRLLPAALILLLLLLAGGGAWWWFGRERSPEEATETAEAVPEAPLKEPEKPAEPARPRVDPRHWVMQPFSDPADQRFMAVLASYRNTRAADTAERLEGLLRGQPDPGMARLWIALMQAAVYRADRMDDKAAPLLKMLAAAIPPPPAEKDPEAESEGAEAPVVEPAEESPEAGREDSGDAEASEAPAPAEDTAEIPPGESPEKTADPAVEEEEAEPPEEDFPPLDLDALDPVERLARLRIGRLAALLAGKDEAVERAVETLARYSAPEDPPAAPDWTRPVEDLLAAIAALRSDAPQQALPSLQSYLAGEQALDRPVWPRGFRLWAGIWRDRIERWQSVEKEFGAALAAHDPREALAIAREFRSLAAPYFSAWVTRRTREAEAMLAEVAREARAAEEQAREERRARDRERLDQLRAGLQPDLRVHRYRDMLAAADAAAPSLETEEGREELEGLRDRIRLLDRVKTMVAEALNRAPPADPVPELGGRIAGVVAEGIRVDLDGRAEIVREWDRVSAATLVRLAVHALRLLPAGEPRQTEGFLALAVFCAEHGNPSAAARYAALAIERDPSLESRVRRLLPDLPGE